MNAFSDHYSDIKINQDPGLVRDASDLVSFWENAFIMTIFAVLFQKKTIWSLVNRFLCVYRVYDTKRNNTY